MLLPHGMDGQGPEHSSANIHRYLQAMDDDLSIVNPSRIDRIRRQILESNLQIVCCSNPANYFHALRRQMRREFRKPLIMFDSKKLLRYKDVIDKKQELKTPKKSKFIFKWLNPKIIIINYK